MLCSERELGGLREEERDAGGSPQVREKPRAVSSSWWGGVPAVTQLEEGKDRHTRAAQPHLKGVHTLSNLRVQSFRIGFIFPPWSRNKHNACNSSSRAAFSLPSGSIGIRVFVFTSRSSRASSTVLPGALPSTAHGIRRIAAAELYFNNQTAQSGGEAIV